MHGLNLICVCYSVNIYSDLLLHSGLVSCSMCQEIELTLEKKHQYYPDHYLGQS